MPARVERAPQQVPPQVAMAELGILPFEMVEKQLNQNGFYNTALGDHITTAFAPATIVVAERVDALWEKAKQEASVVTEKALDVLDAMALAAVRISQPIAQQVEKHPKLATGVTSGVIAFSEACGFLTPVPPPAEPSRPEDVQPANTPSAAEQLATAVAQGTPPAGRVDFPIAGAIPTSEATPVAPTPPAEVRQTAEWQKHFTLVSPSEAREMLARARERGEFKFLAPQFDLSKVTKDFAIENRTLSSETYKVVHLVMRGIEQGATFYANQDGQGSGNAPSSGLTRFISISIDNGVTRQSMSTTAGPDYKTLPVGAVDWPLSPVFGVKDATASLKIGDPLFTLPTEEFIDQGISTSAGGGRWRERLGDWQVDYILRKGDDFSLAKLEDVLRHPQTGKMVALDTTVLSGAK